MVTVQSFGTSLLTPQVKTAENPKPASVEEVLNNTPAPVTSQNPDTFSKEGEDTSTTNRRGINWFAIGGAAVVALGLFFAGRAGWMGKYIQERFGGKPSMSKINKKIENKMAEYLNISEGGKVKIITKDNGKKVLQAEFGSGNIQEYSIVEGENLVKLKGRFPDCELNEEYITFSKTSGSPVTRVNLKRNDAGKVEIFQSYKGAEVLNKNFDNEKGLFKLFTKTKPKRKYFGLFGPKQSRSFISEYTDPTTGLPKVTENIEVYKGGKKAYLKQAKAGIERKIYLDGPNGKVSKIVTTNQDGQTAITNFVYDNNGKIDKSKISITDNNGMPTTKIAWR